MAIPKNRKSISTNLPFARLDSFLDALEKKEVQHVPGTTYVIAESARCEFDFEDTRCNVNELEETITSVMLVSAKPSFVRTLIDELEAEISVAVKERDYNEAKCINSKIEDLKNLL